MLPLWYLVFVRDLILFSSSARIFDRDFYKDANHNNIGNLHTIRSAFILLYITITFTQCSLKHYVSVLMIIKVVIQIIDLNLFAPVVLKVFSCLVVKLLIVKSEEGVLLSLSSFKLSFLYVIELVGFDDSFSVGYEMKDRTVQDAMRNVIAAKTFYLQLC